MDKFLEVNIGTVITWLVMLVGFVASYVRQTDRVEHTEKEMARVTREFNERMDRQDRMLEEIKSTGSPSSRTAIMVLNSRVENQSSRVADLEKVVAIVAGMARDIEWMKIEMQRERTNNKEPN